MIEDLTEMRNGWVEQFIAQKWVPCMRYNVSECGLNITITDDLLLQKLNSTERKALEEYMARNHKQCVDFFTK